MTRRLSRHTLLLMLNNVGSAALSFALSVLIGRVLGRDGLGAYAAVIAWMFPLGLIAEFGLNTLMTREVAKHPEHAAAYLRAVLRLYAVFGAAVMVALWVCAPLLAHDPAVVDGLRLSAPLLVIAPSFGAFTALFRGVGNMTPIPLLNIGMWLAQLILTALAFAFGGGFFAALVVNVATSAGQLAAAWGVYRRTPPPSPLPVHREGESPYPQPLSQVERGENECSQPLTQEGMHEARAQHTAPLQGGVKLEARVLLQLALPFAIGAALVALQGRASTILLERLADTAQTGTYAAANRFVEAGRMLPNAFFGALFPALAALAARPQEMRSVFRRALWILAGFGALAGVGLFIAAPLLTMLYGEAFALSIPVLQVLGWSLLPALLRAGITLYLYAKRRESYANAVTAIILCLQIALGLWMIPDSGALGAAAITLAVEIVGLGLILLAIRNLP